MIDRIARTLAAAWEAWTGDPGGVYTLDVQVHTDEAERKLRDFHAVLTECVAMSERLESEWTTEEEGVDVSLAFDLGDDDHGLN